MTETPATYDASFVSSIFSNPATGWGTSRDRSQYTQTNFGRVIYNQAEYESLYEQSWLVQRLVNVLPDEATRAWVSYSAGDDADILKAFEEYQDRIVDDAGDAVSVQDIFFEALCDARLYGGALIYMDIDDGQSPADPVNESRIKSINYLQELDRHQVTPIHKEEEATKNRINRGVSWDYSKPSHYQLNLAHFPGQSSAIIHRSRVLRFSSSIRLPFRRRQMNQGWNQSVVYHFIKILQRYESVMDGLAALVPESVRKVWKIEGVFDRIEHDKQEVLRKRVAEADTMMSLYRIMVLDKDKEEFETSSIDLGGLQGVAETFLSEVVAAVDIPKTYLLGISPIGKLGDSGTTEQQNMAGRVANFQQRCIARPLNRLNRLIFLSKDGPTKGVIPDGFEYSFNNPYPLTVKEEADLFSQYAGVFTGMVASQILFPEEVADNLFGQGKPNFNLILDKKKREEIKKQAEEEASQPPQLLGEEELSDFEV